MTKAELQVKYPHHKVVSEPLETCPTCKGTGEYRTRHDDCPVNICICPCLGGEDELRRRIAKQLRATVRTLRAEANL